MQCDTTRQGNGSGPKTSPSSPTSPFLPTVSCSSHIVSGIRRPRLRDELTSQPLLQLPQLHLLSIPMPYPPIPTATNVATPSPRQVSFQGTVPLCLQQLQSLYSPVQTADEDALILPLYSQKR